MQFLQALLMVAFFGTSVASNAECSTTLESNRFDSDDALLLQKNSRDNLSSFADSVLQSFGLGKSQKAASLLQKAMDLLPNTGTSTSGSSPIDIAELMTQAGVFQQGNDTTHLTGIDKDELEKVKDIIRGVLRENLKKLHDEDQQEVEQDYDSLVACGTVKDEALGTPATQSLATVTAARTVHNACRSIESDLLADNATNWTDYVSLERDLGNPPENCPAIPKTLAAMTLYFDQDTNAYYKWINDNKVTFTRKKAAYDFANQAAAAKKRVCDSDQSVFERNFCEHKRYLHTTCSTFDSCYQRSLDKYHVTKDRIRKSVKQRKDFYRSSESIICHLDVILQPSNGSHTECRTTVADVSVDHLVITPTPDLAKSACSLDSVATAPGSNDGSAAWITQEYTSQRWAANTPVATVQAC